MTERTDVGGGIGRRGWIVASLVAQLAALLAPDAVAAESVLSPRTCLARAVYWEAKQEGRDGMVAVGWVVLNRQQSEGFPDTVCGVVHEGGETPPCQFSWWCDGRGDRPREAENWALALEVAELLLRDPPPDPTDGALFFHNDGIDVPWTLERTRTALIGRHIYYR